MMGWKETVKEKGDHQRGRGKTRKNRSHVRNKLKEWLTMSKPEIDETPLEWSLRHLGR